MKTAIRKNERVLNLLAYLLRSRRPVTFDRIRADVDGYNDADTAAATVARRFERDKDTLRAVGIELLYVDDEATGILGYSIPKPAAYMGDIELSEREVRLLMVLAAFAGAKSSALVDNLASACQKLLAQSALADAPYGVVSRHLVYPAKAAADGALSSNLQTLAEAVENRRRVTFTYYSIHRDASSHRQVEPYGLKFFRAEWYLVARCLEKSEVRIFRLDRVKDRVRFVSGAGAEYDIPRDFSIDHYVGRSPWELSRKKPFTATVEFDDIGAWLVEEARPAGLTLRRTKGGAAGKGRVRNETAFFKWLVGIGAHARLTSPEDAAARFVEFVRSLERQCAG